ncbi:phosphoserine phosphatase SerB [Methanothermococcus okinawensis]|uniref:phosphoserine phosphatase n=1 Tax=Methanothermococcus okinawensis (strain DSM 14208 / JCM 11175 / IH1) TaxID=647113 RepID=F8AJT8_METOI|nr:phosphoserine phosphatase SerB [Methanothermococcus okinawensis]AEH07287.1 phosphoserine phosphatase SerB [Methanothermococcus okinawensis IH1]
MDNNHKKNKKKLILFDLDSTLIDCETIDEIAKLAGVGDEVEKITKEAMDGKLDFGEALRKRVSLLKGLPLENIRELVLNLKFTKGAEETVKELKKRGYVVGVVSGGFTIATDRVKDILGLDYAYSNELITKDGKLTGEVVGPIMSSYAKGEILEKIAKKEGIDLKDTVVVGDGANDISMFKKAGLKIAFCAKDILKKNADICIDKKDLREILKYV